MSLTQKLYAKKLIGPPKWLPENVMYEAMTGSISYGVSQDSSDIDIVGFCMPKKNMLFPHLDGEISGFGTQKQRFDQYQQHHIQDGEKSYDITMYSIVRFFHLVMGANPNMVDSLFVPQNCVIKSSTISDMVRTKRKIFLSKKCFHTFKGYAFAQLTKIKTKNPQGKRKESVDKYGYDVKYAYHLVRLLSQCEQILEEHDLNLQEEGRREHLKAIRRGEIPLEDIISWFNEKERSLESLCERSKLRYSVDEVAVKQLLLNCLEHQYGSLTKVIHVPGKHESMISRIKEIINE
jgi:uncharacterized protein